MARGEKNGVFTWAIFYFFYFADEYYQRGENNEEVACERCVESRSSMNFDSAAVFDC